VVSSILQLTTFGPRILKQSTSKLSASEISHEKRFDNIKVLFNSWTFRKRKKNSFTIKMFIKQWKQRSAWMLDKILKTVQGHSKNALS